MLAVQMPKFSSIDVHRIGAILDGLLVVGVGAGANDVGRVLRGFHLGEGCGRDVVAGLEGEGGGGGSRGCGFRGLPDLLKHVRRQFAGIELDLNELLAEGMADDGVRLNGFYGKGEGVAIAEMEDEFSVVRGPGEAADERQGLCSGGEWSFSKKVGEGFFLGSHGDSSQVV